MYDAKLASERIEQFAHGHTHADLATDDYFRSAISWQLAILERTLNTLALNGLHSGQAFLKPGNVPSFARSITHGNDGITDQTIWNIVKNDVPALRLHLEDTLRDLEPPDEPMQPECKGNPHEPTD